ncbi:hypothetical protein ZHAS_00006207 [Anopheles sinensis]|uniref:Uncharacterized protein n=1 Tax=Anopheles sinensis TaxID=74873 RepID=A0A084VLP7_ANOSI|nr:hypothetical protein ZHAS_00006207 [Anopheles sinensis]
MNTTVADISGHSDDRWTGRPPKGHSRRDAARKNVRSCRGRNREIGVSCVGVAVFHRTTTVAVERNLPSSLSGGGGVLVEEEAGGLMSVAAI